MKHCLSTILHCFFNDDVHRTRIMTNTAACILVCTVFSAKCDKNIVFRVLDIWRIQVKQNSTFVVYWIYRLLRRNKCHWLQAPWMTISAGNIRYMNLSIEKWCLERHVYIWIFDTLRPGARANDFNVCKYRRNEFVTESKTGCLYCWRSIRFWCSLSISSRRDRCSPVVVSGCIEPTSHEQQAASRNIFGNAWEMHRLWKLAPHDVNYRHFVGPSNRVLSESLIDFVFVNILNGLSFASIFFRTVVMLPFWVQWRVE